MRQGSLGQSNATQALIEPIERLDKSGCLMGEVCTGSGQCGPDRLQLRHQRLTRITQPQKRAPGVTWVRRRCDQSLPFERGPGLTDSGMGDPQSLGKIANGNAWLDRKQVQHAKPSLLEAQTEAAIDLVSLAVDPLGQTSQTRADGSMPLGARIVPVWIVT